MNTTTLTIKGLIYWRQFYLYGMNINGLLSMLSTTLAIYIILCKSSMKIQTYRWYLLNIVVWAFGVDMFISILYKPSLMFDGSGMCSNGMFRTIYDYTFKRIQLVIFICLMCGLASSIISAFIYRLAAVTQNIDILHTKSIKTVIAAAHFLCGAPLYLCLFLDDIFGYPESIKNDTEVLRGLKLTDTTTMCMYFFKDQDSTLSDLFGCFVVLLILIFIISCVGLAVVIIKKAGFDKSIILTRTMLLHRQFTYSLSVQAFLPIVIIVLPLSIVTILQILHTFNSNWMMLISYTLFFVTTLHSTLNSLVMLIMIEPYRWAILKKLPCFSPPKKTSVVVMMDVKPAENARPPQERS